MKDLALFDLIPQDELATLRRAGCLATLNALESIGIKEK